MADVDIGSEPFMTATRPIIEDDLQTGWFRAAVHPGGHVVLEGELDVSALDALRAALDQVLLGSGEPIAIDVAGLSFIDSAAISELLRYQIAASARQRLLCLDRVSKQVAAVIECLDLDHVLIAKPASYA